MSSAGRASAGVALLAGLGVLAGCGGSDASKAADKAPSLAVQAGGDAITVDPTQYCLRGDGQRYQVTPPILEVLPDTTIRLTVSAAVAKAGWSVQVFDQKLEQMIGEVAVPHGTTTYEQISTSDVAPPTFYLVVVESADAKACNGLSGAWPVGFIRTDGNVASTSPTPSPSPTG